MTHDSRLLTPDALSTRLAPSPLAPSDVLAGEPATASVELMTAGGVDVGLWELTPGTVTDVEVDEIFVVLAGQGHVTFDEGQVVDLAPGVVVRLRAGEHATWTITETLRKMYVVLPAATTETTEETTQ
jgi:uncharacterized cupin superfamily protein